MADREQPYDPYIPAGNNAGGGSAGPNGNHRTAALQAVGLQSFHPGVMLLHCYGRWLSAAVWCARRPQLLKEIVVANLRQPVSCQPQQCHLSVNTTSTREYRPLK